MDVNKYCSPAYLSSHYFTVYLNRPSLAHEYTWYTSELYIFRLARQKEKLYLSPVVIKKVSC